MQINGASQQSLHSVMQPATKILPTANLERSAAFLIFAKIFLL
jgi:hypothetical protein